MVMVFDSNKSRWVNENIEQSKTLNHYEKYGIYEVARFPSYFSGESMLYLMEKDQQVNYLIYRGIELIMVNVGGYKSILYHADSA